MLIKKHHKMNCFNTILEKRSCSDRILLGLNYGNKALELLETASVYADLPSVSSEVLFTFENVAKDFIRGRFIWEMTSTIFKIHYRVSEVYVFLKKNAFSFQRALLTTGKIHKQVLVKYFILQPIVSLQYLQIKTMIQTIFFSICLVKFQFSPAAANQFMWESHNESNWSQ